MSSYKFAGVHVSIVCVVITQRTLRLFDELTAQDELRHAQDERFMVSLSNHEGRLGVFSSKHLAIYRVIVV